MRSSILFSSALFLIFFSCKNESEKNVQTQTPVQADTIRSADSAVVVSREILPPIEGVKSQVETKDIKGNAGDTLLFSTGSIVIIPANALVDKKGALVTGNCKIIFEEYLDPAAIILSGIPMIAEEGGKSYPFTSAGMFSIRATAGGQPVTIAPGAAVTVKQATSDKKNTYDFFRFNESDKHWEKIGKTNPETNNVTKLVVRNPEENAPVKPVLKSDKAFTFDMNINTHDFPEFKSMENIIWQSAKEKGFSDAEKDQDKIFSTLWYEVELKPYKVGQSKYILQLTNDKETYRTIIIPTLEPKEYAVAMAEFTEKMKAYESSKQSEQAKRKTERIGADIVRSIEVASFGLYNHDVICRMGGSPAMCKAEFEKSGGAFFIPAKAYLISKTSNTVIQYGYEGYDSFDKFAYDPKEVYGIVTLERSGNISFVTIKEFDKVKQNTGERHRFVATPYVGTITSVDDLKKVLAKM